MIHITKKTYVLNFGKHKGHSIAFVIENDPGYILWLSEQEIVEFSDDILDEADLADDEK